MKWAFYGLGFGVLAIIGAFVPEIPFFSWGVIEKVEHIIQSLFGINNYESVEECIWTTKIVLATLVIFSTFFLVIILVWKRLFIKPAHGLCIVFYLTQYVSINGALFISDYEGYCGSDGQVILALIGTTVITGFILIGTGAGLGILEYFLSKRFK